MRAISIAAIAVYLLATARLARRYGRTPRSPEATPKTRLGTLVAVAVVLHGAALYAGVVSGNGLNLGFFNAVSLVTWIIAFFLLMAAVTRPVENLGIVAFPLAALALLLTLGFRSEHIVARNASFGLEAHIILAILAYSVLTIAAVQAVLLTFQDRQLRRKHPGGIMRALPPLQTMEYLLFQMIGVGFFLLSLAVVSGLMFLEDMFAQHVAHKTILSLVAWAIFGTLLWGRWRFGWRGRVAIRWSLAGFVALMLAFLGTKLVLELILHR